MLAGNQRGKARGIARGMRWGSPRGAFDSFDRRTFTRPGDQTCKISGGRYSIPNACRKYASLKKKSGKKYTLSYEIKYANCITITLLLLMLKSNASNRPCIVHHPMNIEYPHAMS